MDELEKDQEAKSEYKSEKRKEIKKEKYPSEKKFPEPGPSKIHPKLCKLKCKFEAWCLSRNDQNQKEKLKKV